MNDVYYIKMLGIFMDLSAYNEIYLISYLKYLYDHIAIYTKHAAVSLLYGRKAVKIKKYCQNLRIAQFLTYSDTNELPNTVYSDQFPLTVLEELYRIQNHTQKFLAMILFAMLHEILLNFA